MRCGSDRRSCGEVRRHYSELGFLRLGTMLDAERVDALRELESELRSTAADCADRGYARQVGAVRTYPNLSAFSSVVRDIAQQGPHLKALESVIGPDVCLVFTQIVTKLVASAGDSSIPWHQDNAYNYVDPPTNVTVIIALDAMTKSNGCLWIAPGSHLDGLLPHRLVTTESRFGRAVNEASAWRHVEKPRPVTLGPGEGLAFSANLLHRSDTNRTANPRRLLFLEYVSGCALIGDPAVPVWMRPHAWMVSGTAPVKSRLREGPP